MSQPVDLKPIQNLYLENLLDVDETGKPIEDATIKLVGHAMVADVFKGTDVYLTQDGRLQALTSVSKNPLDQDSTPLSREAKFIQQVRAADTNGDQKLDQWEAWTLLPEGAKVLDPGLVLEGIRNRIKNRWAIVAKNMGTMNERLGWKPTLDALETYNDGILMNDLLQANSTMPLNGLTKTGLNLLGSPVSAYRGIKGEETALLADHLAEENAKERHAARKEALKELTAVIEEGTGKQEAWAIDANLDEALKRLKPESRKLLVVDIPAPEIHSILMIKDDRERETALYQFAVGERPAILGYGGGNATGVGTANFYNYTGRHNNLYFARSILAFLGNRPLPDFPKNFEVDIRVHSNRQRKEMLGDGGSFANVFATTLANPFCGFGLWCEPGSYRAWGDEAKMDAIGRTLEFGLLAYGTFKGLQFLREAAVAKPGAWTAAREAFSLRPKWAGGRGFRPLPVKALREARHASKTQVPPSKEIIEGGSGSYRTPPKKILVPEPPPKPPLAVRIDDAVNNVIFSVTGVTIAGIVDYRTEGYYNPFETNHDLEVGPYPDLTQPPPPSPKP